MRVLFVCNFYPPLHIGGYEELCEEVACGLRRRGHALAVLTSRHGTGQARLVEKDVYRVLHPEVDLRPGQAAWQFFFGKQRRLDENLAQLRAVLSGWQPQVVVVWGVWNLPRQLLAVLEDQERAPVVYYVADYWPLLPDSYTLYWREKSRHWYSRWPKAVLGRLSARRAGSRAAIEALKLERVLCVSGAVRDRLLEHGLKAGDVRVVYNGIALDQGRRCETSERARRRSDEIRLLYAGRLTPEKGVGTVLEAVSILARQGQPARLTLVGGGSPEYERELRATSARLGIGARVRFRGRLPRERMPEVLVESDVLVVPSVWSDPLPRVIQEGMAAGLVVVGARVGGIPEILQDRVNGLLFEPGNAGELAERVRALVHEPGLGPRLAQAGRRTVEERFDIARTIDEIERYLRDLVAS